MQLFPINEIANQSDVIPLLVLSLSESQVVVHGVSMSNPETFIALDIEGLFDRLPELPSSNVFIFTLNACEEDDNRLLEILLSIQVSGEEAVVEELQLEIFSIPTSEPLSEAAVVWGSEFNEESPGGFLDVFMTHSEALLQLYRRCFELLSK